jgi:hypothetical protein
LALGVDASDAAVDVRSSVVVDPAGARFDGADEFEDVIQRVLVRCMVPELHASIIFEDVFDDKLFCQ